MTCTKHKPHRNVHKVVKVDGDLNETNPIMKCEKDNLEYDCYVCHLEQYHIIKEDSVNAS